MYLKERSCFTDLIIATLATVLGGIILALIPTTRNIILGIFGAIGNFFHVVWDLLKIESRLPWAFIIILFFLAFPSIVKIVRWFIPRSRKEYLPSSNDYQEDEFFGVLWKWSGLYSNELTGFCPNCKTRLIFQREYEYDGNGKTSLYCETCGTKRATLEGDRQFALGIVWRQIERKINNGEWKQVVEKQMKVEVQRDENARH